MTPPGLPPSNTEQATSHLHQLRKPREPHTRLPTSANCDHTSTFLTQFMQQYGRVRHHYSTASLVSASSLSPPYRVSNPISTFAPATSGRSSVTACRAPQSLSRRQRHHRTDKKSIGPRKMTPQTLTPHFATTYPLTIPLPTSTCTPTVSKGSGDLYPAQSFSVASLKQPSAPVSRPYKATASASAAR